MEKRPFSWKMVLLVGIAYLCVYTVIVEESWLQSTMGRERTANQEYLGENRAMDAAERATDAFNRLFVETSIVGKSFEIFIPTQQQMAASQGIETLGSKAFAWMEKRLRAFWTLIYHFMLRVYTALTWWPLMVLVAIPVILDAMVSRRIKATTFGLTSPHFQGLAKRAITLVVFGYFLLMLAPIFIHPAWTPALVFVTAGALWFAMSQFVKRG